MNKSEEIQNAAVRSVINLNSHDIFVPSLKCSVSWDTNSGAHFLCVQP